MTRTLAAGLDGSPESLAAADWAAREALRRDLPLRLVHAWTREPSPYITYAPQAGPDPQRHLAERITGEAADALRQRHPGLRVDAVEVEQEPAAALLAAAQDSELLALGSRGLGPVAGFLVGSVALPVVAHATGPVVLVRAGALPADGPAPDGAAGHPEPSARGDVVLGLGLVHPDESVLRFAFEAAADRGATLRVVHGWTPPSSFGYPVAAVVPDLTEELAAQESAALTAVLTPWREKYPQVTVTTSSAMGGAALQLTEAAADASLVVVGRRVRGGTKGPQIGSVVHALMHHSPAPVAVVPHH